MPAGSEGWRKAEVTVGGVDTRELDGQGLQSRHVPGLHFIGEVVDVTGWLGGYNFQWAWASAAACARALAGQPPRRAWPARAFRARIPDSFQPAWPYRPFPAQKVPEDS